MINIKEVSHTRSIIEQELSSYNKSITLAPFHLRRLIEYIDNLEEALMAHDYCEPKEEQYQFKFDDEFFDRFEA